MKTFLKKILPSSLFTALQTAYHFLCAWAVALWYGLPARKLFVIGVTGTKGKSSTAEMINTILEGAGYRTALASTIRFKIGNESEPNLFKMTMPGRGHLQKILAEGLRKDCTHAIIELTSEGARQFRHAGVPLDALVFTNIAPEHIESHGSYENYKQAKLNIGLELVHSPKRPRIVIANVSDEVGKKFLALPVERAIPFQLSDAAPYHTENGRAFLTFKGVTFAIPTPGEFSILNALAAGTLAHALGIPPAVIGQALAHMKPILGRVEQIEEGQPFTAVVDYAHTPDSLRALYDAFPNKRKICVLGNTGGGRDTWKRPEMGKIADETCAEVILTNEDPYDEEPKKILMEMAAGMNRAPRIIMDRREAIREAFHLAQGGNKNDTVVLISGKGTDPYIMEAGGKKTPWSDARVAHEELRALLKKAD